MTNHYYVSLNGDDSNPGSLLQPWRTPEHAIRQVGAGSMVYLRGGTYHLHGQVIPSNSGSAQGWITIAAYPGEEPVLDASQVVMAQVKRPFRYDREQGVIHLEGVSYVRIQGLTIRNSRWAGICVIDCQNIELVNNNIENTFSSGISAWDVHRQGNCHHLQVLGNTVTRANNKQLYSTTEAYPYRETPHEAISIAGPTDFEVAYNHLYDCYKEGIDVKEFSKRGRVHHNHVHQVDRQGLYADAWFGVLEEIEFDHNVIHDCRGTGIAISVEDEKVAQDIHIHHNLIYDNWGTGVFFSRWGKDGPRRRIWVHHNTVFHNGWGKASNDTGYYYATGGLYLFTHNLRDINISNNIITHNRGFQIGYSERYLDNDGIVEEAFQRRNISIHDNLVYETEAPIYPIRVGWEGNYSLARPYQGAGIAIAEPIYRDAANGDLRLSDSVSDIGAYTADADLDFWWRKGFPPNLAS